MAELEIPSGTIADKNNETRIILDDDRVISTDTIIKFGNLEDIKMAIDGFYEVGNDGVETWVHMYSKNGSDSGISGIDIDWRELAERVQYEEAEIVSQD